MALAQSAGRVPGASGSTTAISWIVDISQLFYFANYSYASIRQWPNMMGPMSLFRSSCLIWAIQTCQPPEDQ